MDFDCAIPPAAESPLPAYTLRGNDEVSRAIRELEKSVVEHARLASATLRHIPPESGRFIEQDLGGTVAAVWTGLHERSGDVFSADLTQISALVRAIGEQAPANMADGSDNLRRLVHTQQKALRNAHEYARALRAQTQHAVSLAREFVRTEAVRQERFEASVAHAIATLDQRIDDINTQSVVPHTMMGMGIHLLDGFDPRERTAADEDAGTEEGSGACT